MKVEEASEIPTSPPQQGGERSGGRASEGSFNKKGELKVDVQVAAVDGTLAASELHKQITQLEFVGKKWNIWVALKETSNMELRSSSCMMGTRGRRQKGLSTEEPFRLSMNSLSYS